MSVRLSQWIVKVITQLFCNSFLIHEVAVCMYSTQQHQKKCHVHYCAFIVCFLLCNNIDLVRDHSGPSHLKIPMCVSAGSCGTEVSSDHSRNRKSSLRIWGGVIAD